LVWKGSGMGYCVRVQLAIQALVCHRLLFRMHRRSEILLSMQVGFRFRRGGIIDVILC
jgi:hypothetical protein